MQILSFCITTLAIQKTLGNSNCQGFRATLPFIIFGTPTSSPAPLSVSLPNGINTRHRNIFIEKWAFIETLVFIEKLHRNMSIYRNSGIDTLVINLIIKVRGTEEHCRRTSEEIFQLIMSRSAADSM